MSSPTLAADLGTNTSTSFSATVTRTLTAGAAVGTTVVVWAYALSGTLVSVTDSKGNTYSVRLNRRSVGNSSLGALCATALVTTALEAGDTITATFSANSSSKSIIAAAFSDCSDVVEPYAFTEGRTAGLTNMTEHPNALLIALVHREGSGATGQKGTLWTNLADVTLSSRTLGAWYRTATWRDLYRFGDTATVGDSVVAMFVIQPADPEPDPTLPSVTITPAVGLEAGFFDAPRVTGELLLRGGTYAGVTDTAITRRGPLTIRPADGVAPGAVRVGAVTLAAGIEGRIRWCGINAASYSIASSLNAVIGGKSGAITLSAGATRNAIEDVVHGGVTLSSTPTTPPITKTYVKRCRGNLDARNTDEVVAVANNGSVAVSNRGRCVRVEDSVVTALTIATGGVHDLRFTNDVIAGTGSINEVQNMRFVNNTVTGTLTFASDSQVEAWFNNLHIGLADVALSGAAVTWTYRDWNVYGNEPSGFLLGTNETVRTVTLKPSYEYDDAEVPGAGTFRRRFTTAPRADRFGVERNGVVNCGAHQQTRLTRTCFFDEDSAQKDVWPIGIWYQGAQNADDYAALGINMIIYMGTTSPTQTHLDQLYAAGVYAVTTQTEAALTGTHREMVRAWYIDDEPDLSQAGGACRARTSVVGQYQVQKAAEATKPQWLNFTYAVADEAYTGRGTACNGHTEHYPQYSEGADIISFDLYPIRWGKRHTWLEQGMTSMAAWMDGQPAWIFLETVTNTPGEGVPTPDTVASSVWLGIIAGARAICYFGHTLDPFSETGLLGAAGDSVRPSLPALNARIQEHAPILNTPEVPGLTIVSKGSSELRAAMRIHGDYAYVYATNPRANDLTTNAATGTFRVPVARGTTVTVLDEGRTITGSLTPPGSLYEELEFTDTFDPYDVHIYRIPIE